MDEHNNKTTVGLMFIFNHDDYGGVSKPGVRINTSDSHLDSKKIIISYYTETIARVNIIATLH